MAIPKRPAGLVVAATLVRRTAQVAMGPNLPTQAIFNCF
jgi:hypothetical protein